MGDRDAAAEGLLRLTTPGGRWAVTAAVSGSAVAMIASTVVNVALPDIAEGVGADTAGVQWILNSYMLALASLILIGGSLGDSFGRRRVFIAGTVLFGLASLAAAAAPNLPLLLAARVLMGVGGALLTPGSMAILEASFVPDDRAAALGAWAGFGAMAAAVGPLAGGLLLDVAGWRALFLLNVPVCAVTVWLSVRHLPESMDPGTAGHRLDWQGTLTAALGLGGLTYGLIGLGEGASPEVLVALAGGVVMLVLFVVVEANTHAPLVPLGMFANRTFTVTNLLTFVVYTALGGVFFLLVVFLRVVLGYSGLQAGAATLPFTVLMLLLSSRSGRLANRIGPRLPMSVGPLLLALSMLWFTRLDAGSAYLSGVLPGVVVFGLGLVLLVAPLTATVLAAADNARAGVASGISNAVARTAGLMSVAVLPTAAGLSEDAFTDSAALSAGFSRAMAITAVLALIGAAIGWRGLPSSLRTTRRRTDSPEVHEHPHATVDCPPLARPAPHSSSSS